MSSVEESGSGINARVVRHLNNVLPADQQIVSVGPDEFARDALALMTEHGFSQLPVMEGNVVLGAFSYRSFAQAVVKLGSNAKLDLLTVDHCLDDLHYAKARDPFETVIERLDQDGAVFVGEDENLVGIATTVDVLRYLVEVTNVYVVLQEIELAIRELLRAAAGGPTPPDWMWECVHDHERRARPSSFEELAFGDYTAIVQSRKHWDRLAVVFGKRRESAAEHLRGTNTIRNIAFHFKRPVTVQEYEALIEAKRWLFIRDRVVQSRRGGTAK
jgi:predicted transcriptional regulator